MARKPVSPKPARRPTTTRVAARPPDPKRRLIALLVVIGLAFGAVLARLTVVQGTSSGGYAALGQSQRERKIVLPARRGSIVDRNGVELAMTVQQKTVWANPQLVRDPAGSAAALAPILQMDAAELQNRLSGNGAFVYLSRKVNDETAAKVAALKLPGVAFIEEPKRFDPAGSLATSLLGTVGLDNQGLSGLELQYEKQLDGRPGTLVVEQDPHGTEIASGIRQEQPSLPGNNLVLTLDRSMQYETERALGAEIAAANAKGGIAIVMDPRSGEVLAMANLVAGVNGGPAQPGPSNLAVTNVYEPGSVNKLITISAALEEGVIKPDDHLTVPYEMMVANHRFSDHDVHPTGSWSITDIVANSSNIGTIMIGQKLGKDRLDKYLRSYGLGAHSGLNFPGESAGLLLAPKDWSGTSIGTVPIGQGLAVTALQMLQAYNTVANGGMLVPARLVQAVVDANGTRHPVAAGASRRVISTRTAQQMTAMLSEVVRVGTGTAAHIDGYTVAGKTGTAKKPVNGRYVDGLYEASFAGFVPAESPRLSSIVILDEPSSAIYGGTVAAPVFASIAQYGLRRFQIPPPPVLLHVAVPAASVDAIKADAGAGAPPVSPTDPGRPANATTLPPATPTTKP